MSTQANAPKLPRTSGSSGPSGPQPSYQRATESTLAPKYINTEQDYIRECFSQASFKAIHTLPTEIKPDLISVARTTLQKTASNYPPAETTDLTDPNKPRSLRYKSQLGATSTTGCFSTFPYESPTNSFVDALEIRARERKPVWYPNQANPLSVPPDMKAKPKYISPMDAKHAAETEASSSAARLLEEARNERSREEYFAATATRTSTPLFGPFVPSGPHLNQDRGGATGVCRTTRFSLPNLVELLRKKLATDWPDSAIDVYIDRDEYIVLEFGLHTIDSITGLRNYMNTACSLEPLISENGLRKVPEVWNHQTGNGCVYYAFRPHWVRTRITHSYYALNIDERSGEAKHNSSPEPRYQASDVSPTSTTHRSDGVARAPHYSMSHERPDATSYATQIPNR